MGEFMTEDWSHWGELGAPGSARRRHVTSDGCYVFIQRQTFFRVLSSRTVRKKWLSFFSYLNDASDKPSSEFSTSRKQKKKKNRWLTLGPQDALNFNSVKMDYQIIYPCVCTFIHLLGTFYMPGTVLGVEWPLLSIEKDMTTVLWKFMV